MPSLPFIGSAKLGRQTFRFHSFQFGREQAAGGGGRKQKAESRRQKAEGMMFGKVLVKFLMIVCRNWSSPHPRAHALSFFVRS
jgi:hypothetical protein